MEIGTIRTKFEGFEYKSWRIRMQILTIRKGFEALECKFELL